LRESSKKYEILLIIFFNLFFLFILSELLLFISLFWITFHSFSSILIIIIIILDFIFPDPCELTFINTFLLSNAAISLGNSFISLEISFCYILFILISIINNFLFIFIQIKEFLFINLYKRYWF
jgi:hypothetical protein